MADAATGSATRVVLITTPDPGVARSIARRLVEERLAACANIVPGITSIYRWEGALQEDPEVLIVLKTVASHLPSIERRLAELHPYDVPECIALGPERVEATYLAWLVDATRDE